MTVSIVIPNWNGKALLEKNLPKVIDARKNPKNEIIEIIVVDDDSMDDSVEFLKNNFSEVRIIRRTENKGFSSTVNMGVRHAKGKLICLLNTDVIPEKNFLENIHKHFKDKNVFAVGLHEKGYGPAKGEFKDGYLMHGNYGELKEVHESLWASGGSAVFSKKIWQTLKGLDEALYSPFYWEDVDLGYRAQKRGYKILWEPQALVEHKHESVINSDNFKKRNLDLVKERNILLFTWKNVTSKTYFNKHIARLIKRSIMHPGYVKVIVAALKKRKLVLKKRKREILESKLSDEAVLSKFK